MTRSALGLLPMGLAMATLASASVALAQPEPASPAQQVPSLTAQADAGAEPALPAAQAQPVQAAQAQPTLEQPTPTQPAPSSADTSPDDDQSVSTQAQTFDGDAWGDDTSQMAAGPLTFRLALQTRYRQSFAQASENTRAGFALREDVLAHDGDGFKLQRFLLRMAVTPKRWLTFKGTLDFAKLRGSDVSDVVKQALVTLRPMPKRIELNVGIFKVPYSILELDPVSAYELTDFGDSNELINEIGFAGRDVGLTVMLAPLPKPKWLRIVLGAFRGHAYDENASPVGTLAARVESKPWIKGLRFGASVIGMPSDQNYKQPFETSSKDVLPDPPDPLYPREKRWASGKAYGADISYTRKRFTVRVEGLLGDRVDVDLRYGARSFSAIWGLVAYRFKLGKLGLMPAARIELMDADREHDSGGRRNLSFALNFMYKRNVRFVIDVTHTAVQGDTPVLDQPLPLPYYPYLALDSTRLTAQLQLEL